MNLPTWIVLASLAWAVPAMAKVDYHLVFESGSDNTRLIALPPSNGLKTAADAAVLLEGNSDPASHSKINALYQWDSASQALAAYSYFEPQHAWRGNNFKLDSSKPIWVHLLPGADIQVSVDLAGTVAAPLALRDGKGKSRVWLVWPEGQPGKASQVPSLFKGERVVSVGRILTSGRVSTFKPGGSAARDFDISAGKAYFIEVTR